MSDDVLASKCEDLDSIQKTLEHVSMDLTGDMFELTIPSLRELFESALILKQDLSKAMRSASVKIRRYPVRRRLTQISMDERRTGSSPISKKKTRNADLAKNKVKRTPAQKQTREQQEKRIEGRRKETRTRDEDLRETTPDREEVLDEFRNGDVTDVAIEATHDEWMSKVKTPLVSLEQVMAAFKALKKSSTSTRRESSSVPEALVHDLPVFEATCDVETRPSADVGLDVHEDVPVINLEMPVQRDGDILMQDSIIHGESSQVVEAHVLPSGYIVQSVQMVLAENEAEKSRTELFSLSPMIHPEFYVSPTNIEKYVPVRAGLSLSIQYSNFQSVTPPREMVLSNPCSERIPTDQRFVNVDVTGFLARMQRRGDRMHPMVILPHQEKESSSDPMNHLFMHLLTNHPLPDGERFQTTTFDEEKRSMVGVGGLREGTEDRTYPLSDEDRLKSFTEQLEKHYNFGEF